MNFVQRMGYSTPEAYIENLRKSMRTDRASSFLNSQAKASYYRMYDAYRMQEEEIKWNYVLFKALDYRDAVEITDDVLINFYTANSEDYRVDTQRVYRYAYFTKNDFQGDVQTPQESDLKNYYERNKEKYVSKGQTKIQAIELPFVMDMEADQEAQQKAFEAIQEKAQNVYEILTTTDSDFGEVADRFNDIDASTSATMGAQGNIKGLVDSSRSRELGTSVVNAAERLQVGEISQPMPNMTSRGNFYTIIKVLERSNAGQQPFSAVKAQVEAEWRREKQDSVFEDKFEELSMKIPEYTTFDSLIKDLGM